MKFRDVINNRALAVLCILALLLVLTACGGGGSGSSPPPGAGPGLPEPPPPQCDDGSRLVDGECTPFARRFDRRASTPFLDGGAAVELEVVLYAPLDGERFPLLVFNHGSTGNGGDPALFTETFTSRTIIEFFVDRGWMVAFPQRRGRGRSDGLYDEGFNSSRSGYSCNLGPAQAGAERALADLDAALDWLLQQREVDPSRVVVGGTSRGGVLSIMHVARRGDIYRGALNFVGGWTGEGCGEYRAINRSLFQRGAGYPAATLWLYAERDSFYSVTHSQENFAAFEAAGGVGEFLLFERAAGLNGHFLINSPALWAADVDRYLGRL